MDLLVFLLCFTIFSGLFHPFFYQSHILLYHLVFAATADVSYLVLLLFRELAFAQEILLSGLVSIIIVTIMIVSIIIASNIIVSIITVTIIIVVTITHMKSQPETHPCQFEPPSAGRG